MVGAVRDAEPADPLPALASGSQRRERERCGRAAGRGGEVARVGPVRRTGTLAAAWSMGLRRVARGLWAGATLRATKLLRQSLLRVQADRQVGPTYFDLNNARFAAAISLSLA